MAFTVKDEIADDAYDDAMNALKASSKDVLDAIFEHDYDVDLFAERLWSKSGWSKFDIKAIWTTAAKDAYEDFKKENA